MNTTTIGADPEVFIANRYTGLVYPIVGMLGGTKEAPLPMAGLVKGFAVQEDNVMAEYNIPPTDSSKEFTHHIHNGLGYIRKHLSEHHPSFDVVSGSSYVFGQELLYSPQANLFGCSPDNNAHNMGSRRPPVDVSQLGHELGQWRFAGGHVHIGLPKNVRDADIPMFIVAMLADLYLGLPSVSVDKQPHRRALYGQAGTYRDTSYGIEYRTLSNFWIFDRNHTRHIANNALLLGSMLGCSKVEEIKEIIAETPWTDVQAAINNEDERLASSLIGFVTKKFGIVI